jgi:hypothetical protein
MELVSLYGHETWFLTQRFKLIENKVLRRIHVPKKEQLILL